MPDEWPAGSVVVMLDGGPRQVGLSADARGQLRHWRIGPASKAPDDQSYRHQAQVFAGAGLRPLSPCHLRISGRELSWIRRTRVGGDGWDGWDVPLGEASERYAVTLTWGGTVLHRAVVGEPAWIVPGDVWAAAAAKGSFAIEVAQLSDVYGPGPSVRRMIHV